MERVAARQSEPKGPEGPTASGFKEPAREIVALVDAPRPPVPVASPAGDMLLLVEAETHPPLAHVAEPVLCLAGLRLSPVRGARQHLHYGKRLSKVNLQDGQRSALDLPAGARIGLPLFSPDGAHFAFLHDAPDRTELWLGDSARGTLRRVEGLRVNDVLADPPLVFAPDGRTLWVTAIPTGRGDPPPAPLAPAGPSVQESVGRKAPVATYQDLLRDAHDEALFTHYTTAQWTAVDTTTGAHRAVGAPGLLDSLSPSPDGRYLLSVRLVPPYSYRVGHWGFPRVVEVLSTQGDTLRRVAELPLADDTPRFGVRTGARAVWWQAAAPATLTWVQALDGGDPRCAADHRDALWTLPAPFTDAPREAARLRHRLTGLLWTDRPGQALVNELDRDRRWRTTSLRSLDDPAQPPRVLFDRNDRDAYADPGDFVCQHAGSQALLQQGPFAWLVGDGATPEGPRPFLDRIDLDTGATQRVFRGADDALERVLAVLGGGQTLLVQHETPQDAPSLWLQDTATGVRRLVSAAAEGALRMDGVTREILRYTRQDGVPLSGTLYLPRSRAAGERLPLVIWAYPVDHSDAGTAGQVRASAHAYVRPIGASVTYFATQGWAVLMDAAMPVVGDTGSMNDRFIEQVAASAAAAIDALDARGLIDRRRVVVAGHSYGAFMAANLLAHTDLFAAGIARNGAYNRSLTPFGFQQERRTYWEAPETYHRVSPFVHADRIQAPLLLIHGETDPNPGTHPMQSERLYGAIAGTGGTARLVMLPREGHAYRARESILHVLAEMLEWAQRWTRKD